MKKIATLCGVSEATVSNALGGKTGVSGNTRQRITDVAEKYNYRPNALVRSIQEKRTRTVGIAINDFHLEFVGTVMTGIVNALHANNYEGFIINWDTSLRDGAHVLRSMAERRVDGILMYPPGAIDPRTYMEEMRSFHAPMVLIDMQIPHDEADLVCSDDYEGAYAIAKHVIELGHRKIAINCGILTKRFEGFRDAMLHEGVRLRPEWVSKEGSYQDAYDDARRWLAQPNRPTAILSLNDEAAAMVRAAAYDSNVRIPDELSITGFADLAVAKSIRPMLTTVNQDAMELGRRSAELLLFRIQERIDEEDDYRPTPQTVLLPTKLIVRGSTAPPPTA